MNIPHLGQVTAALDSVVLPLAGVDPRTHTTLTWHEPRAIAAARAEGRIVARFVVRYSDPECYVVSRPQGRGLKHDA